MIATGILAVIVLILLVQRERDTRLLERQVTAAAAERKELLDRIQHPERAIVTPVSREPHEVPRDSAELAHVGAVVPTGVQVGGGQDA